MPEGETDFDAAAVEAWPRSPLGPREDDVFRLGLALNGTVASCAWTAGVLDFLVEALDLWDDKKRQDRERGDGRPTVPDHEVRLGMADGSSGGGLCAALLARAAGWDFSPATDAGAGANRDNPFWRAWVEDFAVEEMPAASGRSAAEAVPESLLLDAAAGATAGVVLGWPGAETRPRRRAWLADPLRVTLAASNPRDVPCRADPGPDGAVDGQPGHHPDPPGHALFAIPTGDGSAAAPDPHGEEHLVRDAAGWKRFADFARAAAAFPGGSLSDFPGGLPARRLGRPATGDDRRGLASPGEQGQPAWDALDPPAWRDLACEFIRMARAAMPDQTLDLARTALFAPGAPNARDSPAAVLMLDPPSGPPVAASLEPRELPGGPGAMAAVWAERERSPAAGAAVPCRFPLSARRERDGEPRHGAAALAAGTGAFPCSFSRAARVHDYMLGRENCRYFLMHEFVLREDDPVFRGLATRHPDVAEEYSPCPGRRGWLPIVPVAEHLRVPRLLPEWPRGMSGASRSAGFPEAGHPSGPFTPAAAPPPCAAMR